MSYLAAKTDRVGGEQIRNPGLLLLTSIIFDTLLKSADHGNPRRRFEIIVGKSGYRKQVAPMGNLSSTPKVTAQDRAILDLKLQRDKLKQYQKKIQYVLDREQAIAREWLATGNRTRALTALRRRKYQEGLLLKTDTQLETLQNLVSTIEFSLVEKDIIYGLKQGNDVLTEIHKEMSLEGVEKLMEETVEAIEYQKEISQILQSRMTHDEEDAVQRELETMQREAAPEKIDARVSHLPAAPSTEPEEAMPVLGPPSDILRHPEHLARVTPASSSMIPVIS